MSSFPSLTIDATQSDSTIHANYFPSHKIYDSSLLEVNINSTSFFSTVSLICLPLTFKCPKRRDFMLQSNILRSNFRSIQNLWAKICHTVIRYVLELVPLFVPNVSGYSVINNPYWLAGGG